MTKTITPVNNQNQNSNQNPDKPNKDLPESKSESCDNCNVTALQESYIELQEENIALNAKIDVLVEKVEKLCAIKVEGDTVSKDLLSGSPRQRGETNEDMYVFPVVEGLVPLEQNLLALKVLDYADPDILPKFENHIKIIHPNKSERRDQDRITLAWDKLALEPNEVRQFLKMCCDSYVTGNKTVSECTAGMHLMDGGDGSYLAEVRFNIMRLDVYDV